MPATTNDDRHHPPEAAWLALLLPPRAAWALLASLDSGCGRRPNDNQRKQALNLDPRSGWPYDLDPLWIMLFDLWLALRRGDPAGLPSSSTDRVARAGVAGVGSGGWGVAEGLVP